MKSLIIIVVNFEPFLINAWEGLVGVVKRPTWQNNNYYHDMANNVTVALDLLSLGDSEDAAGSPEKAKERLLTASILQSKTSLWRHKVQNLYITFVLNLNCDFMLIDFLSTLSIAFRLTCPHIKSTEQPRRLYMGLSSHSRVHPTIV